MRKIIMAIFVVAGVFASCTKESNLNSLNKEKVSVTVSLDDSQTKAGPETSYPDGNGSNVDHWVVEVRDVQEYSTVYYHGEKSGEKGVLTQSFELSLVKGHTYQIAFWADKSGCYKTQDLSAIECNDITKIGNSDDFDGFFKSLRYEVKGDGRITAKLFRPFAQVNIITSDLSRLKSSTTPDAYSHYAPVDYTFKLKVPTVFDAFTGEASSEKQITIVPVSGANHCYGDYQNPSERTTMYMVYLLTTQKTDNWNLWKQDVRNIDFAFNAGNVNLAYDLDNIPLKRNYRTNIIGSFMTNTLKWEIEVVPAWRGGFEVGF